MAGSGGTAGVSLFAESSTRPLSGDGVGGVGKFAGGPWRSGDNPAAGSAPAPNGVPGIDDAAGIDGDAGIDGFAGTDGDSGDGEIGGNDDGGNLLAACASDRPKPKSDAGAGAGSPHTPNVPVAPPPDARSLTGGVGSLLPTSPSGLNEDGCGPRFGCGADFAPKICVYSPASRRESVQRRKEPVLARTPAGRETAQHATYRSHVLASEGTHASEATGGPRSSGSSPDCHPS